MRVRNHTAIRCDHGYPRAALGRVGNPVVQHGKIFRGFRREVGEVQLVERQDPRNGLQLANYVALVAASQGSFGKEIHGEQYAQQKRQKGQREFPK